MFGASIGASAQPLARLLRVLLSVETTIHTALEGVVNAQNRSTYRPTGNQ